MCYTFFVEGAIQTHLRQGGEIRLKALTEKRTDMSVAPERTLEGRILEEVEEIPVVSDVEWQGRVARGIKALKVMSQHTQFERCLQDKHDMGVNQLCREQRLSLATDLEHISRR